MHIKIYINSKNNFFRFLLIQIFINSLISVNIFKFFIIIKIVDLGFININFYIHLYTFVINFLFIMISYFCN